MLPFADFVHAQPNAVYLDLCHVHQSQQILQNDSDIVTNLEFTNLSISSVFSFGSFIVAFWLKCNRCHVWTLIYIFIQILAWLDTAAYLHIDVCIILLTKVWVVGEQHFCCLIKYHSSPQISHHFFSCNVDTNQQLNMFLLQILLETVWYTFHQPCMVS